MMMMMIIAITATLTIRTNSISHFLNHAQNKVRVSVGGRTRFVNMTDWKKKVKRSIITEKG